MRKPAWGLRVNWDTALSAHCSKLGGNPYAPTDFIWPRVSGQPYRFVGQIDLASLPTHPDPRLRATLPAHGMLLFFSNPEMVTEVCSDTNQGAFVHYCNTDQELTSTPPPNDIQIHWSLNEAPLEMIPVWTLPSIFDENPEFTDWKEDDITTLDKWIDDSEHGGRHQLLGFSSNLQSPIEHPTASELGPGWRLLFQVWSDEQCDLDIFAGGAAYFAIECNALQNHDFRRVALICQFT